MTRRSIGRPARLAGILLLALVGCRRDPPPPEPQPAEAGGNPSPRALAADDIPALVEALKKEVSAVQRMPRPRLPDGAEWPAPPSDWLLQIVGTLAGSPSTEVQERLFPIVETGHPVMTQRRHLRDLLQLHNPAAEVGGHTRRRRHPGRDVERHGQPGNRGGVAGSVS